MFGGGEAAETAAPGGVQLLGRQVEVVGSPVAFPRDACCLEAGGSGPVPAVPGDLDAIPGDAVVVALAAGSGPVGIGVDVVALDVRDEAGPFGVASGQLEERAQAVGAVEGGGGEVVGAIRAQLLPTARRVDTGVVAIAGKHRLDGDRGAELPPELLAGAVSVLPAARGLLFTAVWRGDQAARAAVPDSVPVGFLFDTTTDYIFWAYADAASAFPDRDTLERSRGHDLTSMVLEKISGWSPALRSLVAGSEPGTVNALRIRSAEPVKAWTTGPVTLLGDAIHNMTPMAGIGANTALRDAELLTRNLTTAVNQKAPWLPAIADYEQRMLDHGFRAVAASLRNARLAGNPNRVLRGTIRGTFRLINHFPALKNRMFAPAPAHPPRQPRSAPVALVDPEGGVPGVRHRGSSG